MSPENPENGLNPTVQTSRALETSCCSKMVTVKQDGNTSYYKNSLWYHTPFGSQFSMQEVSWSRREAFLFFILLCDIVCVGGSCWKACRNLRIWLKAVKLCKYIQKLCTVSIGICAASLWWNQKTLSAYYLFCCECLDVKVWEHLIWNIKIYLE